MSTFFYSSYDSESSSDEDVLYYSDDERHLQQRETSTKSLLITGDSDDSGEETMSESEDESPAKKAAFLKEADSDEEEDDDNEGGSSDEDEWSNSDSDSDSDSEAPRGRSYFLKKDFLKGSNSDSDSDDEDEKKIVRSAKDKYLAEIADLTDTIENLSMVEEWIRILSEFDKLSKLAYKHQQHHISIPRSYIKAISVIEDAVNNETNSSSNGEGKKLNASESKSLNILKQKIKKEVKAYREEVDLYKQDPEAYEAIKDEAELLEESPDAEKKELVVSIDNLFPIVQSIIESRGKKGIDQREQLKTLNELLQLAQSTYEKIILLNLIISSRFELHTKEQFVPSTEWNVIFEDVSKLMDVLDEDRSYIITEVAPANDDITTPPPANSEGKHLIVGSITSFVERLSDELTSHLLYLDPNSSEYISLLKDDSKFYALIVRAQVYLTRIVPAGKYGELEGDQLCRIIIKRLESIYYKPVQLIVLAELNAWNLLNTESNLSIAKITTSEATDSSNISQVNSLMDNLCSHLYQFSTGVASPVYRKRAALMQAYYYATSNQFFRARDILHLTHVQTTIHTSEPGVQVLFNRAIVQLGLAAFRSGLLEETQTILNEVVTSPHTRELLGQGRIYFSNSNSNSSGDSGSSEKGKYVPFHMHVNIELVDAVYYISSLLFEVPLMALQAYQGSTPGAVAYANGEAQTQAQNAKKNFSRSFKRILEYTERQYFQGPAEETRDTVFEAYNHLVNFNWKAASKILCELRVWNMMPGVSVSNSQGKTGLELLNDMLVESCKIQALKTWTYVNSGTVKNYSVRKLAARFEIDETSVCNAIGGLIYREEIRGFLKFNENGSKTVIFEKKEDGMGEIVRGLTDRVNSILERNEKLSLGGYQIMLKKK